jgi:hypothetical protein
MERVPTPESSNLASIGYDQAQSILEVQFKPSKKNPGQGPVYQYLNVPYEKWVGLLNSPSKGGYLSREIKGAYQSSRVS